ncbi:hypothetical protein Ae201684_002103 [Aphanomyces euteiches]|uniref:Integrator complex subunit 6-like beta-barrel domain-containing protein n=1 Tax=Aphanomyces euteiches TaxID=100861 RepID=A0A6G0XR62_9STRA|nr:hypothetical protein Ae201684_002103 [Aphanomyces euteiches]KAH9132615.1 hypothetical protein AeRB84_021052 [Aphanomyces euteiches]KAH9145228.1 hypothetical protein AeRB84_010861 [Aphanomyces euteiches]KAH9147675.1 hypothetical protein AeRB84_008739 [Aphanomyces euteiches]KAH9147708.1 hypothetical protein AeRB84_008772 [Aphanomyces euteiches]
MGQRSACGMTLMDFAKSVVETMAKKLLARTQNRMNYMHFMLVTFSGVVVGMENSTNREMFYRELKYLEPRDLSDVGTALSTAFDLINRERAKIFCDNYGLGRLPYNAHMTHIVLVTDAGAITTVDGVQNELVVPPTSLSAVDLTRQPFRWDQRLFTVAVQLSADSSVSSKAPPINPPFYSSLCEETGGVVHLFNNGRVTKAAVEKEVDIIIGRMKPGVLVRFVCDPSGSVTAASDSETFGMTKNLLSTATTVNREFVWPIPESFWVDRATTSLPLRDAHPTITFKRTVESQAESATNQMVLETLKFPADSYLVESVLNPLPPRSSRWMVYMVGSRGDGRLGEPFGFLRTTVSNGLSSTRLIVLPNNYPVLFSLLVDAARQHSANPNPNPANPWHFQSKTMTASWRDAFSTYLSTIPIYYHAPLKKVLRRYNLHELVPEAADGGRSYQVTNQVARLKDIAMTESEKQPPSSTRSNSNHSSPSSSAPNSPFNVKKTVTVSQNVMQISPADLVNLYAKQKLALVSHKPDTPFSAAPLWTGPLAHLTPSKTALAMEHPTKFFLSVDVMGDYIPTALKTERLRNPFSEPEKDDQTPEGVRRRKLEFSLDFPYKTNASSKGGGTGLDDSYAETADEAAALGTSNMTSSSRRKRQKLKNRRRDNSPSPILSSPESSPQRLVQVPVTKEGSENLIQQETAQRLGVTEERQDLWSQQIYRIMVENSVRWKSIVALIKSRNFQPMDVTKVLKALGDMAGDEAIRRGYTTLALGLAKDYKRAMLIKMLKPKDI